MNMCVRKSVAVVLCAILPLTSSCSLFVSSTQPINITASDPQAEIYVDGAVVGQGAATVTLAKNQSHAIMARVGDRVGTANVSSSISATGVLDIVGGVLWLVPLLGLFGGGFYKLDADQVTVAIPPPR